MKKILILTVVLLSCCFSIRAQITQAEYFIDTDPGQGAATTLIAADGNFDAILESAVQSGISIAGLGFHSINIRLKDLNGNWGPIFKTIVLVENLLSVRNIKVSQAELFFDTDPGQGSGTTMLAFDGNYSDAIESVMNTISVPAVGLHKLNIRIKDVTGNWGPLFTTVLKVDNILTPRSVKIAAAELFWDTDPGQGNGTALLAFDGNYSDAIESVLNNTLSSPTVGFHKLNVRIKDVAGNWGAVFSTVIHIENLFIPRNVKVNAAELFWDNDPGQGSGTIMVAFDGNYSDAVESVLNNTITTPSLGFHKLSVRVKDVSGNWGPVFSTVQHIENTFSPRNLKIVAGEMFFDADPGQGSGIAMVAFDGNYDNAMETISNNWQFLPSPGYHSLSVRSKDVAGNWGSVFTVAIHFLPCTSSPVPTVSSAGNITSICPGDSVLLTASGSYSSYTWFKGSTQVGTGQTYYAKAAGSYQVYVTDGTGCPGYSSFLQINVTPISAVIAPSGATTFCQGGNVILDAGSGYASYLWSSGQATQSITVTATGTFNVTISNGSCNVTSAQITVTVNPVPSVPSITPSGATTFCMGQNVTLTASPATSYYWSTGAVTQAITVNQSGNYTVTAYNATNCSAISAATIVTVNNPAAIITPSASTTFCQGDSITLTVSANSTYLWSNSLTTQSIVVKQAGTYSVVVTDGLGCTNSSLQTVVTVNSNPPTPTINLVGANLVSSAVSSNQWYLNGVLITGATSQSYTFTQNGLYTVLVTNGNACSASSATYNVTSIGMSEQTDDTGFAIYPNPVSDFLFIKVIEKIKTIKCVDYLGQEIALESKVKNNSINISSLSNGVYFLIITSESGDIVVNKFVKQ
ncbi:MAG: hypothetical protein A3F72_17950 [Bacteroidetes bacterium RIFCSPLOWO2_12_FULL_35_15]|nr:MAG: hypothetical protein A3F72_17950 [Bacteroidetes bacterium RIFCSPLOWO2_12_FULL_35_15]